MLSGDRYYDSYKCRISFADPKTLSKTNLLSASFTLLTCMCFKYQLLTGVYVLVYLIRAGTSGRAV
jgi:hypothetical protein